MFVSTPAASGVGSVTDEPAVDGVDVDPAGGCPAGAVVLSGAAVVDGAVDAGAVVSGAAVDAGAVALPGAAVDAGAVALPGAPAPLFWAIDGVANAATASMAATVAFEILAGCCFV
jgi:hypothetical protein